MPFPNALSLTLEYSMRTILALTFTIGVNVCLAAASSPETQPKTQPKTHRTMLQFLESGNLVGVQSSEGTTSVTISIYSEDRYELAKQISTWGRSLKNAKMFADGSELAQAEVRNYLLKSKNSGLDADEIRMMPLTRTNLGKVLEVGDDFVLVEFDREVKQRCVIAKAAIAKIYLDANPVRFYGPRPSTGPSIQSR